MTQALPPGSQGLPWLGHSLPFLKNPLTFMQHQAKQYGLIFRTRLIGRNMIFALGPEANQLILSTHAKQLNWREGYGPTPARLFGPALVVQDGAEHAHYRSLLTPAFRAEPMDQAIDSIAEVVRTQLHQHIDQDRVEFYDVFKRLAFAVAGRVLLGIDTEPHTPQLVRWFNQFSAGLFTPFPWSLPGTTFGRALKARQHIAAYFQGVIDEKRQSPEFNALRQLMDGKTPQAAPLPDEEIIAQMLLMLFAGHDTTASLSTWLTYELGTQPDLKAKVQAEQDENAGDLSLGLLRSFRYLEACIKEAERKYPPAPTGFRGVMEDLTFQGYNIPKGWTLIYSPLFTHHMPSLYPNPERFEPERMLAPRQEHKQQPYALVGFGGGPRKCIGEHLAGVELKTIFALLHREFSFEVFPDQDVRPEFIPSMHPKRGLYGRIRAK